MELTKMLTKREVLCLVFSAVAVIAIASCSPYASLGPVPTTPPTETLAPTATATVTETPTLQPTVTETPTATSAPDRYAVDVAKLFNNMPADAAEFVAGVASGKYVQSPSLISDKPAFEKWVAEQLVPALGDLNSLPASMQIRGMGREPFAITFYGPDMEKPISVLGKPEFFYFTENGGSTIYPVMVLKFATDDGKPLDVNICNQVVTLMNPDGTPQTGVLEGLSESRKILDIGVYFGVHEGRSVLVNQLVTSGVNGYNKTAGFCISIGMINFLKY
jgi:hypothetical protein